ncbi:MAG: glycoside hydrolase family 32 protein [Cyclobacteriaceae bacterium]|jgi:fructan beta-fructosidase|nr:glycoside hydrolase family 32 protein [Cyclobacteriaceae bacterium]
MQQLFYTLLITLLTIACSAPKEKQPEREAHRLQFHFTPPSGWMNDPNGLVYYDGEYHLFYQHYPDSTVWGPMHWGHAISRDLIHWEHQPIALYPDSIGTIFSGSAVVDENNTSGLQTGNEKALIAMFTYDKKGFETQGIAYSNDKGRTWTKHPNNPVIKNPGEQDYRDPKIFWHEASAHWILSLAVKDRIEFYRSKNLIDWEKTGTFGREYGNHGGVWECPDLFPLTAEGTNDTHWVLLVSINPGGPNGGSATQYFIGNFDGKTFTTDADPSSERWIDWGPDNYAGVTWSNAPDGRKIFIGWMSNWLYGQAVPTERWRSAMTLPRELSLKQTAAGLRLSSLPSPEVNRLRGARESVTAGNTYTYGSLAELQLTVDLAASTANDFGVEFFNAANEVLRIGYNRSTERICIDRTRAGKKAFSDQFAGVHYAARSSDSPTLKLHLYIDVASAELFADDGTTCMTSIFFPNEDYTSFRLFAEGGDVTLTDGFWHRLTSVY